MGVIPAVFQPESREKLDAGLRNAGMTRHETDILMREAVLSLSSSQCGRVGETSEGRLGDLATGSLTPTSNIYYKKYLCPRFQAKIDRVIICIS